MDIPYVKIETNKNSYVLVKKEVLNNNLNLSNLAQKICSKSHGIGCEGLIIIDDRYKPIPSIRCFNLTGSESIFSINGLIVAGFYLLNTSFKRHNEVKVKNKNDVYLVSYDDNIISVDMNILNYYSKEKVRVGKNVIHGYHINTGNNNFYIINRGDISIHHFKQHIGKKISKKYQANVGLIDIGNKNNIRVITYERGVGLMTSSGSNICGALYVLHKENLIDDIVEVDTFNDHINCDISHNNIIYKTNASIISKGVFYL